MRTKDHFEMREYNIDVIEDEKDSSFHAKGRPYPIYPSKGGLSPDFLRDIIARLVPPTFHSLNVSPQNHLAGSTTSEAFVF